MPKTTLIATIVPINFFRTNGSTIRARGVIPIIKSHYQILVITRTDHIDYDILGKVGLNRENFKIFGRCSENPYFDLILQILCSFKLINILIKNKVQMIYGQGIYQLPAYYLASKILKCKFIYEAHSLTYKEQQRTSRIFALFIYLIEFLTGKLAQGVIALSNRAYFYFRKLNTNVFYIPVFVDTDFYDNKQKKQNFYDRKFEKRIGVIGPFDTKYNRHQLEFSLSNIKKFDERICFILIGQFSKLLPMDRLIYLGFLKTQNEYIQAISELDALIVPVKIGTYGPKNKIVEAMACSLPVFTTPQGAFGLDFARPNENILIFEERELTNKINELIFNESFMRTIGNNARKTVELYYSKSVNEQKLLQALEEILREVH